jgi:type IV pilus assembly protein PilB
MKITEEKLKNVLVDSEIVDESDFATVVAESEDSGVPLERLILEKRLIPEDYLGQLIAEEVGYPFANLKNAEIPDHVLRIIPENVAKKKQVVAFKIDEENGISLAMRDPEDLEFIRNVEKKVGVKVSPFFVMYGGLEAGFEAYTKDLESAIKNLDGSAPVLTSKKKDEKSEDGRVVRIVHLIMNYAFQNNASDIHIEPREGSIMVRYRVDGILHDVAALPHEYQEPLVTRIKILSKLRTDEHFAAQDGKFQETIDGDRIDVRVSILPIVNGEKVVMRLLAEKGKSFNLEEVGLGEGDLKGLRRHAKKSFGMILVTGPTGSGKTTTLYATLRELNTRDVNIATIEDPIEYAIEGVNQIQVNPKTGLTFASGLRSIVRQDPDIVMVGEIRDPDTASIAVNAAMTGHLVLSTLHTNDAATALPRFQEMGVESFLIASTINVIVAQRLVRKICNRCIVSKVTEVSELSENFGEELVMKRLKETGAHKRKTVSTYHGKGCDQCNHSGYQGRLGIFEVLEMDDDIRELVMRNANSKEISQKAIENGMTTMLDDGIRKVLEGITTVDEVLRVTGAV